MKNKLISLGRAILYTLFEPIALNVARILYLRRYRYEIGPLISVYCPTYNRKEILLGRAVKSVLAQSYKNFEFIIVGDHCTDGTGEMLALLISDSRVKFVNLPTRKKRCPVTRDCLWMTGPVVPANHALTLCKGSWIARIDDDDIWTTDHLEKLLYSAQFMSAEFMSSSYDTPEGVVTPGPGEVGGHSSWFYRSYLRFFKYNIDCWRKTNNRVNDLDMAERMGRARVKMRYLPRVTYKILPRPGETEIGSKAFREGPDILEKYKFDYEK